MDINEALRQAHNSAGWSRTRLAFEAGVSEASARGWLLGHALPASDKLEKLRVKLPGLAELLDSRAEQLRAS